MDAIEGLSLSSVLVALNAWTAYFCKDIYRRWAERRRFRHFRILVIGRSVAELENIYQAVHHGEEHNPIVKSSDLVVTALHDAGFLSEEIPSIIAQACQDTRGRFGGLIGKLSEQVFNKNFIEAIEHFFESQIRVGGNGLDANDS